MSAATVYCAGHGFIGNGRACPHCQRERQLTELRAKAPLRKPREQHDVDGLALFDQARQPTLF